MKNQTKAIAVVVTAVACASSAVAQNASSDRSIWYDDPSHTFRGNELSIDAFGTDAISQYTINHPSENRVRHDSTLGAGIGVNYFILPFIGIGGEGYTENTAYHFVDDADGSLILRLPIPLGPVGLAPYAFGGAGHKFDPVQYTYEHLGAGLEVRILKHLGVFVDGRYVFADHTRNYGLARAGVRISF